jgi:hypothetical protein
LPLDFHLTAAEAADSPQFDTLLDLEPDATPRSVIAERGYDAKANHENVRERGSLRVSPVTFEREEPAEILSQETVCTPLSN